MATKKKARQKRRSSREVELEKEIKRLQAGKDTQDQGHAMAASTAKADDLDTYIDSCEQMEEAPPAPTLRKRRRSFTVNLKGQHADWLERMAFYEGRRRKEKIEPGRMLEILVREAYAADPTKGGTVASETTGPAIDFNKAGGDWEG